MTRIAEAQREGLSEETIGKVATFRDSDLGEREKAALEYAECFILDAAAVDDSFFAKLKTYFSEEEIVELGFILIMYNGLHRFNASIGLEPQVASGLSCISALDVPAKMP